MAWRAISWKIMTCRSPTSPSPSGWAPISIRREKKDWRRRWEASCGPAARRAIKAEDFDEEADFLAANISSFIGATSGSASVNFLSKDVDKALDLFFDMLRNPAFQQDRLDLYKSQQLQQIERRNDRTDEIEAREWNRLLRGEKHFTNIYSTKDSLSSITRDDLIAFHKKYYQPANFIFAVSGDFKTDEIEAEAGESNGRVDIFRRRLCRQFPSRNMIPCPVSTWSTSPMSIRDAYPLVISGSCAAIRMNLPST